MARETQAVPGPAPSRAHDRMYHVSRDGQRWTVDSDEGRTAHFASDRHMAIGMAIRTAQQDHADGLDVIVCVEQPDGAFAVAWTSP